MSFEEKDSISIRIFFTGVGGQGTLLATRLVGEAALHQGLTVTMSEIHGMAQRGGVVESSVVIGSIFSPTIADGEADVLMAFEPLETLRALPKCHTRSWVISSTVPIIPFTVSTGKSAYPSQKYIYDLVQARVERLIRVDALELARQAGSELTANMVMLGTLAGVERLPITEANWRAALRERLPGRFLAMNEKAFALGYELGRQVAR
jgi:indolepyruvate ferredoxin oxidoreductase, beta subunit